MKTKTKTNLKRALLFFIPLCLIAGMLVVPAFAATHVTWKNVDASTTLEPTTITQWGNGAVFPEANTSGMYAIVFDDLAGDIVESGPSSSGYDIFPGFIGVGYLEVVYNSGTRSYYLFGSGVDTNSNDIEVGIYLDIEVMTPVLRIGRFDGTTLDLFVENAVCTFYFTQYPPVEITSVYSDALYFWNSSATYNVYMVSEGSVTPDPEPPAGGDDDGEGDTSGIFAVWTQITDWIINGLKSATNAFYYNGQLTLLGYLCIIPLALGVALLLISIIQKFLRLRG